MKDEYLHSGRSKQKLKTRAKIVECARHFFREGKEITLEAIADEAGVSRATIYRYYSSADLLLNEVGIELQSPEDLYRQVKDLDFREQLLGIQDYFNQRTTRYEEGFRKHLGAMLSSGTSSPERGARRIATLQKTLQHLPVELSGNEKKYLLASAAVLMDIEPLIVTKDICRLDNDESLRALRWALEMILLGCLSGKEPRQAPSPH